MQLTKQTDFAFRILLYLGQLPEGELANIKVICAFYDISQNHIAKVVVKLTKLGYLSSVRGHGGGIRLAISPSAINLANVITDFETTLKPVNCDSPPCKITSSCQLKGLLFEATNAFMDTMRQRTLADLLPDAATSNENLAVEIK
ncbi:Rrf2 family transcriptional regulator [Zhongshania sp.]|jgi:Rrf2 family nitric oxide-sensitive transcriptional repressor|uniref:Rrf2 family transcriptional regulator n=1 Tax=Zhongshania sp. TaxID=1971902 RepID=UPI002A81ECB9|nr:Rrf2 family transcriptional regulator [Zhongshania sp.]